ncbi:MAG TPA: DUF3866 family protein [Actinomycetota bacterium]|nr:DUF3866 family protein [Actinomycetota bacterium]
MPRFATGVVAQVLAEREGVVRLIVRVGDAERPATAFTKAIGPVAEGDRVVVNTTAVDLDLGSGGEDFVVWNLEREVAGELSGGHILKLRYTPWQIDTLVAEAPESPHHAVLASAASIDGLPVVACGVHSQIAAVTAVLKCRDPALRIAYVMTDGAALPLAHSDLVATLRGKGLIDLTITCGHAFGGDLETVNVFSGLAAARHVGGAAVAVVAMGPGIVGTETVLGHTGMEQGQTLSATASLGGLPIAPLRISFAEPRERHRVVSHHSLSALRYGALARSIVAVPRLPGGREAEVLERLETAGIAGRHDVRVVDAGETLHALDHFGLEPITMGRTVADDPAFHLAAGAAGIVAVEVAGA